MYILVYNCMSIRPMREKSNSFFFSSGGGVALATCSGGRCQWSVSIRATITARMDTDASCKAGRAWDGPHLDNRQEPVSQATGGATRLADAQNTVPRYPSL